MNSFCSELKLLKKLILRDYYRKVHIPGECMSRSKLYLWISISYILVFTQLLLLTANGIVIYTGSLRNFTPAFNLSVSDKATSSARVYYKRDRVNFTMDLLNRLKFYGTRLDLTLNFSLSLVIQKIRS